MGESRVASMDKPPWYLGTLVLLSTLNHLLYVRVILKLPAVAEPAVTTWLFLTQQVGDSKDLLARITRVQSLGLGLFS